jgi:hypothetical protein
MKHPLAGRVPLRCGATAGVCRSRILRRRGFNPHTEAEKLTDRRQIFLFSNTLLFKR